MLESLPGLIHVMQLLFVIVASIVIMYSIFKQRWGTVIVMMIFTAMIMALPMIVEFAIGESFLTEDKEKTKKEVEPAPTPEPTPEPEPAPVVPAEPIDWQPILVIISIAVAAAVLTVIGTFFVRSYTKRKFLLLQKQQVEQEKALQWNALRNVFNESLQTVFNYETTLSLALKYPAMNNSKDEYTAEMLRAVKTAQELNEAVQPSGIGGSDELMKSYREAVNHLDRKVKSAELNAQKLALKFLSTEQRKDFELAASLLTHASNDGTPDRVRVNYLDRLKTVIERINERSVGNLVPAKTMKVIEKLETKEITA